MKCMGKLVTSRIQQSLYDIITHDGMTIQLCDAMELILLTFPWIGHHFGERAAVANLPESALSLNG